jgi:hypothetical protein
MVKVPSGCTQSNLCSFGGPEQPDVSSKQQYAQVIQKQLSRLPSSYPVRYQLLQRNRQIGPANEAIQLPQGVGCSVVSGWSHRGSLVGGNGSAHFLSSGLGGMPWPKYFQRAETCLFVFALSEMGATNGLEHERTQANGRPLVPVHTVGNA